MESSIGNRPYKAKRLTNAVYRTYPLEEALRQQMSKTRKTAQKSTAAFLADAIVEYLPRIVAELAAVGVPAKIADDARPARLPLDSLTIDALKRGANATGVPATRLLAACIDRASRGGDSP